ncbi:hypothetical protein TL16_g09045 [Triparma laevis f. inornata]|uniref:EF-hand domain-containing protein n=1 Tax=Triparma laevis f. inornata TaxID=1714386 RepID=A0A9W7B636_9STRA|nr:hypothetical protein TL16_g09045 [Triparma laevis f. inornata]
MMSAPLRYLLGDFYRLNLLPTPNKFKVSTLDSAYDDHHSEKSDFKVSNGCFVDKKIDMQGMILQDDKTDSLVVVFRGTDTNIMLPGILSGALKDMRLTMITGGKTKDPTAPDSKGKVHRGMAKAYRRNFKTLVPIIERLWDTKKYKRLEKLIVVTGHSLGGALATIFIKGLYESVPSARSSLVGYTFGGYAIGDDDFMSEFNSKIPNFFRCINREDFVPHYVTPWWKGWRHVGVYIHMTDSKFFYNCEPFELKETDWESTTGSFFDPGTNHSLMAYSKNLEMYRCLNLMSEDQVNRCQKAWADVIRPVKAQTVGSLVGLDDNSVGTSVEFVNSVQPNFDLVPDHLDSEFEAEIEGHGKITIEEFEIMIRKGSLGHTHSFGKTEAVAWPSFVSCCYKLFYDPDKLSVSQRLEKGKFLAAFRKYDVDFDGFLNPEEFGEMCENEFKEMSKEEIVESAKKIDVDVDGYISEREFLIWGLVATDLTRR